MAVAPNLTLNNGIQIPAFGLGTYTCQNTDDIRVAVRDAIEAGYRHFDSAYMYGTEKEVAQGILEKIAEGVVKPEDIFFVTKLWATFHKVEHVERIFRASLANSGLDYVDLYLIHLPVTLTYHSDNQLWPKVAKGCRSNSHDLVETWRELEKLVKLGLIRSIGVCNFNSVQIDRLLSAAEIRPVVNQIECSPAINPKQFAKFCKERDILLIGSSPLSQIDLVNKKPAYLFDVKVQKIADKYNKSPVQIVLRYLFELGVIPIPRSVNKSRIIHNINIFDFKLIAEDHAVLDGFNNGHRIMPFSQAKTAVEYPFNIPY